jgi:hypothetical protein
MAQILEALTDPPARECVYLRFSSLQISLTGRPDTATEAFNAS